MAVTGALLFLLAAAMALLLAMPLSARGRAERAATDFFLERMRARLAAVAARRKRRRRA